MVGATHSVAPVAFSTSLSGHGFAASQPNVLASRSQPAGRNRAASEHASRAGSHSLECYLEVSCHAPNARAEKKKSRVNGQFCGLEEVRVLISIVSRIPSWYTSADPAQAKRCTSSAARASLSGRMPPRAWADLTQPGTRYAPAAPALPPARLGRACSAAPASLLSRVPPPRLRRSASPAHGHAATRAARLGPIPPISAVCVARVCVCASGWTTGKSGKPRRGGRGAPGRTAVTRGAHSRADENARALQGRPPCPRADSAQPPRARQRCVLGWGGAARGGQSALGAARAETR